MPPASGLQFAAFERTRMTAIRLITGLGNIGPEYEATRHNAGFWFVDALADRAGVRLSRESKFHGTVARATLHGAQCWLLQPGTYMNRSGRAVAALANFYRIAPEEILVVHDELDLLPGQSKMKQGGGHAGHNGLKDIQAALGSPMFWRLRIGIGHPRTLNLNQPVEDFVLHPPRRDEAAAIGAEIERALAIVPDCLAGRMEAAMLRLHTRPRPSDDGAKPGAAAAKTAGDAAKVKATGPRIGGEPPAPGDPDAKDAGAGGGRR
jgi:PTH1 family peptidyl-tRNA hydrolase